MPAVSLQNCQCGILFRILYKADTKKQTFICEHCKRDIDLVGTVVEMHSCSSKTMSAHREWVRVPMWRIKDSPAS